jgi:hypothetical protein
MDKPWMLHGYSMDNPWILHGYSMDNPEDYPLILLCRDNDLKFNCKSIKDLSTVKE